MRRLLAAAGLIVAMGGLLWMDPWIQAWRYRVLEVEPSGGLKQILYGLRDFGQIVPMVTAGIIVFLGDRRRAAFIAVLLGAQLLVALASNGLKWTLPRYRPVALIEEVLTPRFSAETRPTVGIHDAETEEARGRRYAAWLARVTPGETWQVPAGPHPAAHESFPSGHSAGAFAFAGVLAWFYPHLRWLFWGLASGCAASRVIDGAHWPGDCLAGALIGFAAAWLALRPYAFGRPLVWIRRIANGQRERALQQPPHPKERPF